MKSLTSAFLIDHSLKTTGYTLHYVCIPGFISGFDQYRSKYPVSLTTRADRLHAYK
jgi:hypothetical protein